MTLVILVGVVVTVVVICVSKHEQTSPTSEEARDTMLDQTDSFAFFDDVVALLVLILLVLDDLLVLVTLLVLVALLVLVTLLVLVVFTEEEEVSALASSCLFFT